MDLLKTELTDLLESDIHSPFKLAVDQAGHAIFFTNPNGEIQYVNIAFEELTGYSQGDVIGENPRILNSGMQDKHYYERLWKHIKAGNIWEEKVINQRADSSYYTASQKISPLKKNNKIIGFVAIQQDITEEIEVKKQLENTIQKKTELLQELHHRSRNNLQFITSLLNLQARNSDNKSIKDELKMAKQRIQALELIYADYEVISDATSLNLKDYLNRLERNIFSESGSSEQMVSFEVVSGDDIFLYFEIAKHVGLIVNELLTALFNKDSIDPNDKLHIETALKIDSSDDVEIRISCRSTDVMNWDLFNDSNALGLKLVENLVANQLKGSLDIKSDQVLSITINFPIEELNSDMVA